MERYGGNPLALNMVAQTIADLFGGDIRPFLQADTAIFGGIAELLSEQWGRLSPLEQTLLFWLAILREPMTWRNCKRRWWPRLRACSCWKPSMDCAGAVSSSVGNARAALPCSRWCWSTCLA